MNSYLTEMITQRKVVPKDDLLTRLVEAEVDGEQLTQAEIRSFCITCRQGRNDNESSTNAILCLIRKSDQLAGSGARRNSFPRQSKKSCGGIARHSEAGLCARKRDTELHGQNDSHLGNSCCQ